MVDVLINSFFFNFSLLFSPLYGWRLTAGRTGPAKGMVNNSGLGQIKKNNKATIYKVMDIKCGKYF